MATENVCDLTDRRAAVLRQHEDSVCVVRRDARHLGDVLPRLCPGNRRPLSQAMHEVPPWLGRADGGAAETAHRDCRGVSALSAGVAAISAPTPCYAGALGWMRALDRSHGDVTLDEHYHRRCMRCRNRWAEQTDAQPKSLSVRMLPDGFAVAVSVGLRAGRGQGRSPGTHRPVGKLFAGKFPNLARKCRRHLPCNQFAHPRSRRVTFLQRGSTSPYNHDCSREEFPQDIRPQVLSGKCSRPHVLAPLRTTTTRGPQLPASYVAPFYPPQCCGREMLASHNRRVCFSSIRQTAV